MKIKSYVITHDHGFAPNPDGEYLTLATCKPKIRSSAMLGDIIIATGSSKGNYKNKLIYAGKISEIISMDEYFRDSRFEVKKPTNNARGDNIYYQENNQWVQLSNSYHFSEHIEHDLKSKNILICKEFWYFGDNAPLIPSQLSGLIKKGPGHKNINDRNLIAHFLIWLSKYKNGINGKPSNGLIKKCNSSCRN